MKLQMRKDDGKQYIVDTADLFKLPLDTIEFNIHVNDMDLKTLLGLSDKDISSIKTFFRCGVSNRHVTPVIPDVYASLVYDRDGRKVIVTYGASSSDDYKCWCEVQITEYTIKFILNDDFCDHGASDERVYTDEEIRDKVHDLVHQFLCVSDIQHINAVSIEMFNI